MLRIVFFSVILSGLFIGGCKKCDCPDSPLGNFTIVLQPGAEGKDAMVTSVTPITPAPNDSRLFLKADTWNSGTTPGETRSYIQFDYSSIPAGAIINSAILTLYADTTDEGIFGAPHGHSDFSGTNSWYINHVTGNWTEANITWNNQPASNGVGQINMTGTSNRLQNYTIDITNFVKEEIENPNSYHGIMMKLDTEVEYRGIMFCSGDHVFAEKHPRLEINYSVAY